MLERDVSSITALYRTLSALTHFHYLFPSPRKTRYYRNTSSPVISPFNRLLQNQTYHLPLHEVAVMYKVGAAEVVEDAVVVTEVEEMRKIGRGRTGTRQVERIIIGREGMIERWQGEVLSLDCYRATLVRLMYTPFSGLALYAYSYCSYYDTQMSLGLRVIIQWTLNECTFRNRKLPKLLS